MSNPEIFEKVISHCKEYGFVFPSSDIYGGLTAVYDYGQNGVELRNNLRQYWWKSMTQLNQNIVGIDAAIFMHPKVWKASGHVDGFSDPMIDNKDSKKRYRADVLLEDHQEKIRQKIDKEVDKAAKRFGETFDAAMYRTTNPRVMEYQAQIDRIDAVMKEDTAYVMIDAGIGQLKDKNISRVSARYSDLYQKYFTWKGKGAMPLDQKNLLDSLVHKAQLLEKDIRFYHIPDKPAVWRVLLDVGVTWINTDKLFLFRTFYQKEYLKPVEK